MKHTLITLAMAAALPGLAWAHGDVPPPAAGASTFDSSIDPWAALNAASTIAHADDNGNGYLSVTESPSSPESGDVHIGAINTALGGDYFELLKATGQNLVRFDVDLITLEGDLHSHLRVQYHDPNNGNWQGWFYDFDMHHHEGGNAHWDHFSVVIDPTWTDAEAMANGWYLGGTGSIATPWGALWTEVHSVQIHFMGNAAQTLAGGVDNFSVTAVPEAETYAMMLAGLGLVGFAARRRVRL